MLTLRHPEDVVVPSDDSRSLQPRTGLRVGVLTNSYRPVINGVVNSIVLTREELRRQGHNPFLFAPRYPGRAATDPSIYQFPSLQLSRNVDYPVPLPYSPRCNRALAELGLDVLHVHHPFLVANLAVRYRKRLRVPLVYTFHTQYEQYSHYLPLPQAAVRYLMRRAIRRFSHSCDLIIAPSPGIRQLLGDYGISTWTETLPNAIDLAPFQVRHDRARMRAALGVAPEAVVALSVSRLGREKNLDFLLRAFARVDDPDACLWIVGDGPERAPLERMARELAVGERVRFMGKVDYEKIPEVYAAADFYTITSTTEVKPLVVLEALASGLPVVAVAACGTQDTVQHERDGLLSPPSEAAFTAILERAVAEHDGRGRWGEAARHTATGYGIEAYARRLVGFYREAMALTATARR